MTHEARSPDRDGFESGAARTGILGGRKTGLLAVKDIDKGTTTDRPFGDGEHEHRVAVRKEYESQVLLYLVQEV